MDQERWPKSFYNDGPLIILRSHDMTTPLAVRVGVCESHGYFERLALGLASPNGKMTKFKVYEAFKEIGGKKKMRRERFVSHFKLFGCRNSSSGRLQLLLGPHLCGLSRLSQPPRVDLLGARTLAFDNAPSKSPGEAV
jgi:hypothetical protein